MSSQPRSETCTTSRCARSACWIPAQPWRAKTRVVREGCWRTTTCVLRQSGWCATTTTPMRCKRRCWEGGEGVDGAFQLSAPFDLDDDQGRAALCEQVHFPPIPTLLRPPPLLLPPPLPLSAACARECDSPCTSARAPRSSRRACLCGSVLWDRVLVSCASFGLLCVFLVSALDEQRVFSARFFLDEQARQVFAAARMEAFEELGHFSKDAGLATRQAASQQHERRLQAVWRFEEDERCLAACQRLQQAFFLCRLRGRKPKNRTRSLGSPLADRAAVKAEAPGIAKTGKPCSRHARTSFMPGSASVGVPLSESRATGAP